KQGLNEIANAGLGQPADSWIAEDSAKRSLFADAVPPWSHDIALAQRRLEDAGWRRANDGIFVSSSGERMETEIRVPPGASYGRVLSLLGDGWRSVGAEGKETQITAVQQGDREYIATHPFADALGRPYRVIDWEQNFYSCSTVARPETKWAGRRDGYCNPAADQ